MENTVTLRSKKLIILQFVYIYINSFYTYKLKMGIENFHTWIKENYNQCFLSCRKKTQFDCVYVDVNHVLHNAVNGVSNEKEYVTAIENCFGTL